MISQEQKDSLVKVAKEILESPFALSNNCKYSAAVLTKMGNIYSGISYFSDTYTLTVHGEHAALIHAAIHGENEIIAIAVSSKEVKNVGEFTNPCHLCKQLLYESSRKSRTPLLVILSNEHNETKEVMLEEMISYPWPV